MITSQLWKQMEMIYIGTFIIWNIKLNHQVLFGRAIKKKRYCSVESFVCLKHRQQEHENFTIATTHSHSSILTFPFLAVPDQYCLHAIVLEKV
jgi:regulatory protein YycI of two-component signal transduction system YycFG